MTILSTTYFGPVQWYYELNRADCIKIEQWESFQKQTYRNRCVVATEAGTQTLTVPVEHDGGSRCIRDTRISDHGNWRHLHWQALASAYGESPFFDYYADDVRPFFERRWTYLLDYEMEITRKMCELLDLRPASIGLTENFVSDYGHGADDKRNAITPKPRADKPRTAFEAKPYYQVYGSRHGFLPNLSVLDLLFNEGPEGILYL